MSAEVTAKTTSNESFPHHGRGKAQSTHLHEITWWRGKQTTRERNNRSLSVLEWRMELADTTTVTMFEVTNITILYNG